MQRITITIEDELVEALDSYANRSGYQNRSEAVRDLIRAGLSHELPTKQGKEECVVALTYVYDHHVRELSKRLTQIFHHRHELSLAALHVHLDEENCLEVAVLRGPQAEVTEFAQGVIAERGVRHGNIALLPLREDHHGNGGHRRGGR